jgi:hypothetical protein
MGAEISQQAIENGDSEKSKTIGIQTMYMIRRNHMQSAHQGLRRGEQSWLMGSFEAILFDRSPGLIEVNRIVPAAVIRHTLDSRLRD